MLGGWQYTIDEGKIRINEEMFPFPVAARGEICYLGAETETGPYFTTAEEETMKTANIVSTVLVCLMLFMRPAQGQTVQLGGGLGIMVPTSDFGGTTADFYNGQRYGLSTGYAIEGKARFGFGSLHLVGGIGFASVRNSGESAAGGGTIEVSQSILTFKAGPEFHFAIPASPVAPYVGGTIALHRFSGKAEFRGVSRVTSATYDVESASRFGVGFHGGVLIEVSRIVSLDLGLGYNLMNVGGRTWNDVYPSQERRLDTYLSLNDERDPLFRTGDDEHVVGSSRSISSFQVMLSAMFGL